MTSSSLYTFVIHLLCSAVADARGIHSGKDIPALKQPLNISEVLYSGLMASVCFAKNFYTPDEHTGYPVP
jgi:hypothetical protein